MRYERRGRKRSLGLVLLSLFWLLVGAGGAVVLDRQLPAEELEGHSAPDFRLMGQVWTLIDRYYVDRSAVKPRELTYGAVRGMVDALGDTGHSTFLTPRAVRESRADVEGHFPGIGAEVRMQNKEVLIVAPLDGSPAQKAGLRAGDLIFKVDGKPVAGQTLEQVVEQIRGPAGTRVTLAIRDPRSDRMRVVSVVRAVIKVRSVSWQIVPGTRVADIRIASFSKGTAKELHKAVAELRSRGVRAVILDLRNDPGGLLDEAIGVASQFLQGGDVLLEKDEKGQVRPVAARDNGPKLRVPLVALTNAGTASAAEIVAGALRDGDRATVVGETTFGTGTVLRQFPLRDGSALRLAVQEWLTPKGATIWHKGIKPDQVVALGAGVVPVYPENLKGMSAAQFRASKDAQLHEALKLLQR